MNIFRTFKFVIDPSNLNLNGARFVCPSLFEHERYREVVKFYDILPSGKKHLAQKASTLCLPPSKAIHTVDGEESERSWIEKNDE